MTNRAARPSSRFAGARNPHTVPESDMRAGIRSPTATAAATARGGGIRRFAARAFQNPGANLVRIGNTSRRNHAPVDHDGGSRHDAESKHGHDIFHLFNLNPLREFSGRNQPFNAGANALERRRALRAPRTENLNLHSFLLQHEASRFATRRRFKYFAIWPYSHASATLARRAPPHKCEGKRIRKGGRLVRFLYLVI